MIQNLLWKFLGKKYLLGGVVELYRLINGKKTALCTAGVAVVYTLKLLGYLPAEQADALLALLTGGGGVSLMHKLQKVDDEFKIQEKASELRAEAFKRLEDDGVVKS